MKYDFSDEMFDLSLDKNIDVEVEKIFNFYRNVGFPNYDKDDYNIEKELKKLKKFDENSLFDENTKIIKQNLTAQGVLWTYFPHWIEVKCGGEKYSLAERWDNDEDVKKLIKKTYIWKCKHHEPHWTNNRIRQNAKVFLTGQSVSNFRPTVAKFIYNKYGNNGKVMDMSAGYGGRLFGFMASNCKEYWGFEPCIKTFKGLDELWRDLIKYDDTGKIPCLINHGSEILIDCKNKFDLCFTSPPYFDTEKYSDEETQSYKKYPQIDLWINGFLKDTIKNCHQYLKDDGTLIINIANTPKYPIIEQSTIDVAKDVGFVLIDTLYMELSSVAKNKGRKFEPIFVFRKDDK